MEPLGVTWDDIRRGRTTDAYFERTVEVLEKSGLDPFVTMEVSLKRLPDPAYRFGVLCGVRDVAALLEGVPVDVDAMPDGEFFYPGEPVLRIRGRYRDFALLENAILGLLCKPSGIATKALRCRIAARDRLLFSFGTRRVPPELAVKVEYACLVGGFDGISNIAAAARLGVPAMGTMPHALMLAFGSSEAAFLAFDTHLPPDVPRIALVDTFGSPVEETELALASFGDRLAGVRVDSGDLAKMGRELRWRLRLVGRTDVRLYASGGLDEHTLAKLADVYDGFGVGTAVADAPTMDFALKIVEVDGIPRAKVGNLPGVKGVWRDAWRDVALPSGDVGQGMSLLRPVLRDGKIVEEFPDVLTIRMQVLERLRTVPMDLLELEGIPTETHCWIGEVPPHKTVRLIREVV